MADHRDRSQMIGDFLREVAVLWVALYPLEAIMNKTFDWVYCGWIYLMAAALGYLGMILEGTEEESWTDDEGRILR